MSDLSQHHRFLIRRHHFEGKIPTQIASLIRRETGEVLRVLRAMGLEPNTLMAPKVAVYRQGKPKPGTPAPRAAKDPAPLGNPEGENPVRTAEIILRDRITTTRGIEMLDGSPSTLERKMLEANAVLFRQGKGPSEQLGRNPAWHVARLP